MRHIVALRDELRKFREDKRIALVPTMGNLHEGHVSLVEIAKKHADIVVVSIFVNPTQFGEGEDFDSYPRTLEADVSRLTLAGADFVFVPSVEEIYPNTPSAMSTSIDFGAMTKHLCGKSRPGHFDGVGLVVSKLFNIVQPDVAVFGKKDYQQLALIRQLTEDLSYPIEIIRAPIVRAEDGLALSSRNQYLTEVERQIAPKLHQIIDDLSKKIERGEHVVKGFEELLNKSCQRINAAGFEVDYLQIMTQKLEQATTADKELVILVAAWLGKARLLDNQEVIVDI
ncbi:MAG: pantoate--beta-alanine ligase [Gammaproteobacteria bacterium]|nr:MAG: pantoate--beta-alanine ligase [Gammaproteobacteria bacterium]